ncbi:Aste57867_21926 [Aphanomyces stellatus]|uniref:Aste57867_21926 protein n=1 Tax=Aphanomyces stellatus TaxID=120398 RepID=A0A485LIU8_9STRA|nr:hypothetical protein As57867_021857 [Aphanomyces stellatus]VFT98594.1 Aste57867_21926 [Aphanomyces stellatus]
MAANMSGFWGPVTSNMDWCEDNYAWSYYIAEWWNTWSNVPWIVVAIYAMHKSKKAFLETYQPASIRRAYWVPLIVFSGSFAFHSSLTHVGQQLDELPMLYGAFYFHYVTLRHIPNMKWTIIGLCCLMTVLMIIFRHSIVPFILSYAALVIGLLIRSYILMTTYKDLRQTQILQRGFYLYLLGFILWIIDQSYCSVVKPLHLHAFWHLFSGAGTYYWIQFACAHEFVLTKTGLEVRNIFSVLPYTTKPSK